MPDGETAPLIIPQGLAWFGGLGPVGQAAHLPPRPASWTLPTLTQGSIWGPGPGGGVLDPPNRSIFSFRSFVPRNFGLFDNFSLKSAQNRILTNFGCQNFPAPCFAPGRINQSSRPRHCAGGGALGRGGAFSVFHQNFCVSCISHRRILCIDVYHQKQFWFYTCANFFVYRLCITKKLP